MSRKKRKLRTDFRKNREARARDKRFGDQVEGADPLAGDAPSGERVRAKGDISRKRTVAGGLGAFQGQYSTDTALLCAGSLTIIAPSLVIYVAFQRSFVKALLQGAVK